MFTFDEDIHQYRLHDRVLPSVTQILDAVGITDFSKIPFEIRQRALHRGKCVHAALAQIMHGTFDWSYCDAVPDYAPYIRAGVAWLEQSGFKPILIERSLYHPILQYAGTPDIVGLFQGTPTVVDWKTGYSAVPWWTAIQLSAYDAMLRHAGEQHDYVYAAGAHLRIGVGLGPEGKPKMVCYDGPEHDEDFDDFMAALRIVQRLRKAGG